jgi:Uma2 family endonuclease
VSLKRPFHSPHWKGYTQGVEKMGQPAVKEDRIYRYGDYKGWPEDERWELIDGVAYDMSPAPSTGHQSISMELGSGIRMFLGKNDCRVFAAPIDVLLADAPGKADDDVTNVVQPDIVVICDSTKIKPHGCVGAPDWVVEILSPYTSRRDMAEKFTLYERHGVREYWVIDPGNRYVHVYVLGDTRKFGKPQILVGKATVKSTVCPGFEVKLEELFAAIPA